MAAIAVSKFPDLSFAVADAEALDLGESFEFVIVPDVIEHLSDVGAMFRSIRKHCGPGTMLIVTSVNPLWAPVLNLAERLNLKMPEGEHRWLAEEEPGVRQRRRVRYRNLPRQDPLSKTDSIHRPPVEPGSGSLSLVQNLVPNPGPCVLSREQVYPDVPEHPVTEEYHRHQWT
jgi:hypothetical protein